MIIEQVKFLMVINNLLITINEILNDQKTNSLPFLIKIDIEGFEENLFSKILIG